MGLINRVLFARLETPMAKLVAPAMLLLLLLLALLNCAVHAQEKKVDDHGFDFQDHSPYEEGIPNWIAGGHSLYKENFVRLTEDAQSQRGSLWNTVPIDDKHEDWKLELWLKVSGSGRSLYGDGMALWLTKYMGVDGPVFGNMDYFTGLGIFFDTYDNAEVNHQNQHPWISAAVNDGTDAFSFEGPRLGGCHSMFRYHDTDDHASTLVAVEVVYKDGNLKFSVDATNSQQFEECFNVPASIPRGGHLGLTASTGHLSDNHDVFKMNFYTLDKEHTRTADYDMHGTDASDETAHSAEELEEINKAVNNTGVVQVLHEKTREHAQQIDTLHAHLNQRLSGVHDSLQNAITMLQKQEVEAESRLQKLEEEINSKLEARIARVEEAAGGHLEHTLTQQGASWFWPFVCLVVFCGVLMLVTYLKGAQKREHLL